VRRAPVEALNPNQRFAREETLWTRWRCQCAFRSSADQDVPIARISARAAGWADQPSVITLAARLAASVKESSPADRAVIANDTQANSVQPTSAEFHTVRGQVHLTAALR
jgi:hypothetical protein